MTLKSGWWRWVLLGCVLLGALLLRTHHLSRLFVQADETDFFNELIYGKHSLWLWSFAIFTKHHTTNTWGWPVVVWVACHLFGSTLPVARIPCVLVGTGAVLLTFLLVYRLIPTSFSGERFVPAIFAAGLTTIAIPQMLYSQQTVPYGATPFMAAALLLAHLGMLRALVEDQAGGKGLVHAAAVYTAVGSLALCIHPSLGLLLAVSLAFLALHAARGFPQRTRGERTRLFLLACGACLILVGAALLNVKNPKYGFRLYLVPYYHPPDLQFIPWLFKRAYDLGTYHLNLYYNPSLYWPDRLNPAILPLVLLCVYGWILAGRGKFGALARHLAHLGLVATAVPAALSMLRIFPFGGVRQTLFLTPFLFVFTALGFYALRGHWLTRVTGGVVATLCLGLWVYNLPRFYEDRAAGYDTQDIVQAWLENGRIPFYTTRGNVRELSYAVREYPEIQFQDTLSSLKPPCLLISVNWPPLENQAHFTGLREYLQKAGYKATLVTYKPVRHLESLQCWDCLYFPPVGLWIYKISNP